MTPPPMPLLFEPIFKPKPWGGRKLADLFHKRLPPGQRIGESWELVSLPGDESRVRGGPLAGRTLSELVALWGRDLLGDAALLDGRFPLLIKFLDARENLSVQVHPRPDGPDAARGAPIKHEAWYVVDADPGAAIFVGLRPGVTRQQFESLAHTPQVQELLVRRPVQASDCFYLPSGTVHALGAGVVVAEVQTPSDVTYRLYDWGRLDDHGQPRELHVQQGLANALLATPEAAICQPRVQVETPLGIATRLAVCDHFSIDVVSLSPGAAVSPPPGAPPAEWGGRPDPAQIEQWGGRPCPPVVLILLAGAGRLSSPPVPNVDCVAGDVMLIPAGARPLIVDWKSNGRALLVTPR